MILAVDMGNTNIVMGCIDEKKIYFEARISTERQKTEYEYAITFQNILKMHEIAISDIEGSIISSVVPPLTNILKEAIRMNIKKPAMVVGPGIKTGLNILMDDPGKLGSDLVVGAVAGLQEYQAPMAIIDMGTATTICVIDKNRNYIGGMIVPGIMASLDSLVSKTSQLPKIGLEPPRKIIGTNTIDCMKSGILYGNAACLDGLIERIEEELGMPVTVIATGGLASAIIKHCKKDIILDEALLLKGLKLIYDKNK